MDCENPLQVNYQLEVAYNCSALSACPESSVALKANGSDMCTSSVEIWSGGKGVPNIFVGKTGRAQECFLIDRRLHNADTLQHYLRILPQFVGQFDPGNTVVALSQAAKVAENIGSLAALKACPAWEVLQAQLLECSMKLEPRGLSMVSYAWAKLGCEAGELLPALAEVGTRRARDFGVMDVAKMCWAYAKLGVVEAALAFWEAMVSRAEAVARDGRTVDVSMLAWSFATAGMGSEALYRELARATLAQLEEVPQQNLSNLLWAYAMRGLKDVELVTAVSRRAACLVNDFVEYDVGNFCWALAKMDAVDYELFERIAVHTVQTGLWKRFPASMASQAAWAFAVARFPHQALFEVLSDYLSRHVAVFDNQHVATLAWAIAAAGAQVQYTCFSALASYAKGGRLWGFRLDEMCALFWAFAKVAWSDNQLYGDLVHVARLRTDELNAESAANLLWALTHISTAQWVDVSAFKGDICEQLDIILDCLLSRRLSLQDSEALYMAVWCYCRLGRAKDAWALFDRLVGLGRQSAGVPTSGGAKGPSPPLRSLSVLLQEAEQSGDSGKVSLVWMQLADVSSSPMLRAAYLHCASLALEKAGAASEARGVLQRMRGSGLFNLVSLRFSERLGVGSDWNEDSRCLSDTSSHAERHHLHEVRLLEAVLHHCAREGPSRDSVLLAMRAHGSHQNPVVAELRLGITPHDEAAVLEAIVAQHRPHTILELGTRLGCTAIWMLSLMQRCGVHDGLVLTIESDPVRWAIAQSIFELAGVTAHVSSLTGPHYDCLQALVPRLHGRTPQLLLINGRGDGGFDCLEDLQAAQGLGLAGPDCLLLLSHALWCPRLLNYLGPQAMLTAVSGTEENCVAICRLPGAGSEPLAELARLGAESDMLWRRALSPLDERAWDPDSADPEPFARPAWPSEAPARLSEAQ